MKGGDAMTEKTTTSTNNWLIVGQQAWFQPMASVDNLPPFPIEKVNMWDASTRTIVAVKQLLGRGPVDYQLTTFPRPFLIYNSDVEPVFGCPGFTSQEATVALKFRPMKIVVDADSAILFIEVYASLQVSAEFFNEYQQEDVAVDCAGKRTGGPHRILIQHLLLQTKDVLDTTVGAYALYKYPLVWKPLDKTSFIQTHNQVTGQVHRITEERVGGFIPYQLKLKEAPSGGVYSDLVTQSIPELIKTNL